MAPEAQEVITSLMVSLDENVKAANHFEALAISEKERASRLEQELSTLKSAGTPAVELEKVAAFQGPDQGRVDTVIRTLNERGIVTDPAVLVKFATQLKSDPNFALDLVTKVAGLQDPPAPSPGAGIPRAVKEASTKPVSHDDGWSKVFAEGA